MLYTPWTNGTESHTNIKTYNRGFAPVSISNIATNKGIHTAYVIHGLHLVWMFSWVLTWLLNRAKATNLWWVTSIIPYFRSDVLINYLWIGVIGCRISHCLSTLLIASGCNLGYISFNCQAQFGLFKT